MSEVTSVSNLIKSIIGVAIALAAAGTLYDATKAASRDAAGAVTKNQISYGKWNRMIHACPKPNK